MISDKKLYNLINQPTNNDDYLYFYSNTTDENAVFKNIDQTDNMHLSLDISNNKANEDRFTQELYKVHKHIIQEQQKINAMSIFSIGIQQQSSESTETQQSSESTEKKHST